MRFDNVEVRALYWKQPFGSLMLHDKVETRVWDTDYRGWVLIICSQEGYNFSQLKKLSGLKQMARIREALSGKGSFHLNGMAIAIGKLTHCQPMHPEDENMTFVKFANNLYCHLYEQVVPIKPFKPFEKGFVGLRKVTNDIKEQIEILK